MSDKIPRPNIVLSSQKKKKSDPKTSKSITRLHPVYYLPRKKNIFLPIFMTLISFIYLHSNYFHINVRLFLDYVNGSKRTIE